MKTLILSFVLLSALRVLADIPITYADIVNLYGSPMTGLQDSTLAATGGSAPGSVGCKFQYDGIDITINTNADKFGVAYIHYIRAESFANLEIGDLLKGLSPNEAWVQVDDKNWSLPKAGAKAHWDGEGKLDVIR